MIRKLYTLLCWVADADREERATRLCENCNSTDAVEEIEVNQRLADRLGISAALEPPNYHYFLCGFCREQ